MHVEDTMNKMLSVNKLNQALQELKEISKKDFLLYTAGGELITKTVQTADYGESVIQFTESPAESQVVQGWIFFRIDIQGHTEYVLLSNSGTEIDNSYVIGRMAASQMRSMISMMQEPENKYQVLRQMLTGEIAGEQLTQKSHQLQFRPERYMLYVIRHKADEDAILVETIRNLLAGNAADYVIEMDASRTVLIKSVSDIPGADFEKYAWMIVDNVQTEAMMNVWVGYGRPADSFEVLARLYAEACTALQVGITFNGSNKVFCYDRLGIGRLIYKLPADLCELYLKEVLGENMDIDLDEETLTTINQLFDNNLNISETARQLFIHRNTLVYRLERTQKKLGLDIRSFEDAMLFKIAMMVRVHLDELQKETL